MSQKMAMLEDTTDGFMTWDGMHLAEEGFVMNL